MPCPICNQTIGADHRKCVYQLFNENRIQSVEEWEKMTTAVVIKGRVRIRVLPEPPTHAGTHEVAK